jgi:trehalose 6-phosphate synthase
MSVSRDRGRPADTRELPVIDGIDRERPAPARARHEHHFHAGRPLVIAANRLPVSRGPTGWTPSPGGLVRALLPLLRATGGTWVGWTGEADDAPTPFTYDGVRLHPVKVTASEVQDYYEGFANDTLWPLYHDALRDSTYDPQHWAAYSAVNERFAETLAEVAPPDAIVWIHDYHLQLVPQMLRDRRSDLIIGFFFHIPFPPVELFMRLPWRTEIAAGLAGCDLVGFQRSINAANFTTVCEELLWRQARVGSYPISIDVEELEAVAAGRATRQLTNRYRSRLGEPEVVLLGVDRLDYTKGIAQRLRAFESLLEDGTLDAERCVMVQVATPTREGVETYQTERREIEQLISEINGVYGRLGYPAIHYLYRTLPLEELVPLYRTGDVMLVTPLRDGMNLVAKEYVTTRLDGDGVLVLSEFAGAADELTDAVLVNPHDGKALREAIITAVEMHRHERRARMARLREVVRQSDVQGWAERFLADLTAAAS